MRNPTIRVWNGEEHPAEHPYFKLRPNNPVTDDDLGGSNAVLTAGLRGFECEILEMDEIPAEQERFTHMNEALFQVTEGRARIRVVNFRETLDLYTVKYNFGDAIAPWHDFLFAENYEEVIDEIAHRGLWLINIGGHIPFITPAIPEKAVAYAREKLGGRFFGVDNGEHDCRFVLGACDTLYEKPASLKEGWEHFLDYEYRIQNYIAKYPITLSNNTFQHYLADIPWTRMLGCQICESKPNIPLWHAILRGAARQYGLKWWTAPAEWNLWGSKAYCGEDWGSPEMGTSISLLKRAWLLTYMYGASAIMGQYAYFLPDGSLSPVGEVFMSSKEWIETHPDRGIIHTPVALIWDFYTGYVTGRHAPLRDRPYMAWGNIPYTRGHYQIDAVNDAFWPGMVDSGFMRNEDGYLSDTPCGDIFDVLLSNTSLYALSRYNAAIVLGTSIEGELFEILKEFAARGGSIATSVSQLSAESYAFFGISALHDTRKGRTGAACGVRFNEPEFTYYQADLSPQARITSTAYDGTPLAYELDMETGGTLLVFLSDHMLTDQVCDIPDKCPTDSPLPRPFQLLRHVQCLLHQFATRWNLTEVRATQGLQWFVNSRERDDELLITLVNSHTYPCNGDVRFLAAEILEGENLMTGEKLQPSLSAGFSIRPNDMAVLRLRADRAIMTHDFGSRLTEESVTFVSQPIFDAFENAERECVALRYGYAPDKG